MKKTKTQHFGLIAKTFAKNKHWAVDQDYTNLLTEEEAAWLSQFNQEYYSGKVSASNPNALHNTPELVKDCYNRNNASNRDLYAIKNVGGMIELEGSISDDEGNTESKINKIADLNSIIDTDAIDKKLSKRIK